MLLLFSIFYEINLFNFMVLFNTCYTGDITNPNSCFLVTMDSTSIKPHSVKAQHILFMLELVYCLGIEHYI